MRPAEMVCAPLGYINDERKHVLVSIHNPSLVNADRREFLQVAITIDSAITLRAALNEFLLQHGVLDN